MQKHADHTIWRASTRALRDTLPEFQTLEQKDDAAAQEFHVVLTMEARRPRKQLLIFKNITATNQVTPSTQSILHPFDMHSQLYPSK